MISLRQAQRAADLHGEELAAFPNVVAVGVRKVGPADRPAPEQGHAVVAYVTDKKPVAELDADVVLPGYVEIPGRGVTHRVAVKVIEIGEIEVEESEERGSSAFSAE